MLQEVARGRCALPGRFLSRCCFTLCIKVEVEPRIAKQYKLPWIGDGGRGKKVSLWLTRRSRVRMGRFGAYYSVEKSPSIKVLRVTVPLLFLNLHSTLVRLLVKWSV